MQKFASQFFAFVRGYRFETGIIAAAFIVSVFFIFENRHYGGDLMMSRIITVERLVEAGTWAHATPEDSTPFPLSIDRIKIGDNFYSSKPPLYPLIMAGEVWFIKELTKMPFYPHKKTYVRILTLLNQTSLYVMMLFCALVWMIQLGVSVWTRRFMLLALSFGNMAYGASVTIHNHPVSAALIFIGSFLVWEMFYRQKVSTKRLMFIGLIGGVIWSTELTAGFFSLLFLMACLYQNPKAGILSLLMFLIPVGISAGLFYYISGSPFPFYTNANYYHYPGSYWNNPQGLDSLQEPKWIYGFHILLGHHGFFSMSPLFLLSVWGFIRRNQYSATPLPYFFTAILLGSLSIFFYVLLKTHNYGGDVIGMRWLFPAMPILGFMILPAVEYLQTQKYGKWICILLLILSTPSVGEMMWKEVSVRGTWEKLWEVKA